MSTPYGSGNVPIVQGVDVAPSNQPGLSNTTYYGAPNNTQQLHDHSPLEDPLVVPSPEFNGSKGEVQPRQFKDAIWAVLFVAHLVIMLVILSMGVASRKDQGGANNSSYAGIVWCVFVCGLVAAGLSSVALAFMMKFARQLVAAALIFSVLTSLLVGIFGLLSGQTIMAAFGFAAFALGCCYAYIVWRRIPFAAANLRTALVAVRANLGLAVVAYAFMSVAILWSVFWAIGLGDLLNTVGEGILFLFLLSYYWVHQVMQNTVHVTNAGVVGTWFLIPEEASTCCSPALWDSSARALTYSFGSICFGSLLVALVQALRATRHIARNNDDLNFLVCIIDCILACIQGIIEELNKWAYVYVGLYGYGYIEAGRNVLTLFQNKGWTTIITDDLADNVLFMMNVCIGLLAGLVGLILGKVNENIFATFGDTDSGTVGFLIGFFVGFLLSSILMSVVSSAVNTVIVCFAEAPAEFGANHPILSQEMREAWVQAWPAEYANV